MFELGALGDFIFIVAYILMGVVVLALLILNYPGRQLLNNWGN